MTEPERPNPQVQPIRHKTVLGSIEPATAEAPPRTRLWSRVTRADSYALLLVLIMVDYFAVSLIGQGTLGPLIQVVLTGAVLLVALHMSRVRERGMVVAASLTFVAVMITAGTIISGSGLGFVVVVICLLLFLTPFAIGRRILFEQARVDIETISGAVDIYLLIGLFFASFYSVIQHFTPTPFFTQVAHATGNQLNYFSFVTLSTLGYGDLSPATNLGRSLVVFEAVLGQLFVVTVIARVISMLGIVRTSRSRE